MKENREEYQIKITKEITEKLNLDVNKLYSVDEINELLQIHNMKGGIVQFVPTEAHSADKIIETLVTMDMIVTDAIHKSLGVYEDKSKCDYCEDYFVEDRMFQVQVARDNPCLCEGCRRKNKIKICFYDFRSRISKDDREQFIAEEAEYGIDYSDYVERLNKRNNY